MDAGDGTTDGAADGIGDGGADGAGAPVVTPAVGSAAGYFDVALDLSDAGIDPNDVTRVTLGGVLAFLPHVEDGRLIVTVQGHDVPGPVEVVVETSEGDSNLGEVFSYEGPIDPVFSKVVGIGASLSQGVQRGTPAFHGGRMAPVAQIARQTNAWVGLPLLHEGLLPQLEVSQIGPPPKCEVPDFMELVEAVADDILLAMKDPVTEAYGYQYARVDADIEVRNISVGGTYLSQILRGPEPDNLEINFMSHMVYEPYGEFLSPITKSQVELVEELKPSLVVTFDMFGNDLIIGIVSGETIEPDKITPADELHADIEELVARVSAAAGHFFVATLPQPSLLPATDVKRAKMAAAGMSDAEIDALVAQVDARADAANEVLVGAASDYDNVHIVDLAAATVAMVKDGFPAGEYHLHTGLFGGLLSLDGVHFTDTGYAMVSNLFLLEINSVLGTGAPLIDIEAVYMQDLESLPAYEAAGFDPSLCQ